MVEVKNATRKDDGTQTFDWEYKMAGLRFHGHCDTVKVDPHHSIELKNTGIPSTFRWTYEARNGGVRITCDVEYAIPTPVLGKMAEAIVAKLNERELDTLLANIKSTVEHGLPAQAPARHEARKN